MSDENRKFLKAAEFELDRVHNLLAAAYAEYHRLSMFADPSADEMQRLDRLQPMIRDLQNVQIPAAKLVVKQAVEALEAETKAIQRPDYSVC